MSPACHTAIKLLSGLAFYSESVIMLCQEMLYIAGRVFYRLFKAELIMSGERAAVVEVDKT